MKTVCRKDACNGCMACVEICPQNAVLVNQDPMAFNSIIDENKCINCHACHTVCPRNDFSLDFHRPQIWYQGWASNKEIRSKCTSGGVATAIIKAFLASGGYVCGCIYDEGEYRYVVTNKQEDSYCFSGSKYVKSNPSGAYCKIATLLNNGEKVLFIGLPCHVAAARKYVGDKYKDKLYTIDIICHGTPSKTVLEKYLNDYGIDILKIRNISFRNKNDYRLFVEDRPLVSIGIADRFLYSFLKKIIFTANCYECQFASIERISDLTLGDSWGSKLSSDEQKKGISLMLSQTNKGNELISMADLIIVPVDLDRAIANNAQLQHSAVEPPERSKFFQLFKSGVRYNRIMFRIFPLFFIKQDLKRIMIKLHLCHK